MGGDLSVILKSLSCESWANQAPSHLKCKCPSCCECDLSGNEGFDESDNDNDNDNNDNIEERSNTSKSSHMSRKSSKKLTTSRKHSKNNLNDK